jgi:hypothetical protein
MTEQKFKHISVGKDGSVWAAGKADGTIFRLYGDAGFVGWVPDKVGKAEVIAAVDWGNAWCVNKDNEIWRLKDAESLDKGGAWTKVPTHSGQADAKTISVGNDGSVWYARTDGALFRTARPGDGAGVGFWVQDKVSKAEVIAAIDSTSVYCINKDREIWFGQNGAWSQIPTHSGRADAKSIAVNPDGYAWYSSTGGAVFRGVRPGDGVGLPQWGTSWDRTQMGKADVLAVGPQDHVWCLNTQGEVWHAFDDKWQQLVEGEVDWPTTNVLSEFEQSMVDFEAEYVRLYQALEIAGLDEIPAAIEALHYLCNKNIDYVLMGLHAQGQATPEILSELDFTDRTWNRFMEDSNRLFQAMYFPISGKMVEGNYYQQGAALTNADLLRGRFRQLARYVHLIGSAAATNNAPQ